MLRSHPQPKNIQDPFLVKNLNHPDTVGPGRDESHKPAGFSLFFQNIKQLNLITWSHNVKAEHNLQ